MTLHHHNDIIWLYRCNDIEGRLEIVLVTGGIHFMGKIELLHGSNHVIEKPEFCLGKENNDYGRGFYCTCEIPMAQEWACKQNTDGFVNHYSFEQDSLKVLDLLDGNHSVLNWIALLLKYRTFRLSNEIAIDARDYIIDNFAVDLTKYDVVTGYRADDSYFSFAESFVQNGLPLRSLNRALQLGKLGEQTVLISEKAFEYLEFTGVEPVDKSIYYPKFIARDSNAREIYRNEIRNSRSYREDIFVLDILREEMKNDDARIQRIVLE